MSVLDDLQRVAERAAEEFEGFKIEVVGDQVVMTPQSEIQSWTVRRVQNAAEASGVAEERLLSDVLIQFSGEPSRAPDVTILESGAQAPFDHEDVLAAVEVVTAKDDDNDYSVKLRQYARFGIPAYLVIDPFRAECLLLTRPVGEDYASREKYTYGQTIDLRLEDGSVVHLPTDKFKTKA